jgi:hypothetical protein
MRWRKRIRLDRDGLNLAADVNAAFSVNRGGTGETNAVRSVSHVRVVQDSGRAARSGGAGEPESERKERG